MSNANSASSKCVSVYGKHFCSHRPFCNLVSPDKSQPWHGTAGQGERALSITFSTHTLDIVEWTYIDYCVGDKHHKIINQSMRA